MLSILQLATLDRGDDQLANLRRAIAGPASRPGGAAVRNPCRRVGSPCLDTQALADVEVDVAVGLRRQRASRTRALGGDVFKILCLIEN